MNTFHSICQTSSAFIPDQLAQGSFGGTIERKEVDCAAYLQECTDMKPFKKAENQWFNMQVFDLFSR